MKKILFLLMMLSTLMLTSCSDIYAQSLTVSEDGISYEYVYDTYPVRIYNNTYYYYKFMNGCYSWVVLPQACHSHVVHLHRPMVYHRPHIQYHPQHCPVPHIAPQRPYRSSTRTTVHRPYQRPTQGNSRLNMQHRGGRRR